MRERIKALGYSLLLLVWLAWSPWVHSLPSDYSLVAQEEEVQKRETLTNPNPILDSNWLQGFTMQESVIERINYANRRNDRVYEIWVMQPPAGVSRATFVKVELYLKKNRAQSLETAEKVYYASIEPNQTPMFGVPVLGSFSGQSIGDYCWAYKNRMTVAGNPVQTSSSLVVVEKDNCFSISVTGSGNGQGVGDSNTERLAKKIVHRLKTWPRPERR